MKIQMVRTEDGVCWAVLRQDGSLAHAFPSLLQAEQCVIENTRMVYRIEDIP